MNTTAFTRATAALGVGLFAAAGCGGRTYLQADEVVVAGTATPPPPVAPEDAGVPVVVPPAVRSNPFTLGSTWYGNYLCPQGDTKLNVHIVAIHGNEIDDALFDFDFDPPSGSRTSGTFHLSGNFDPASGRAVFAAGDWLVRPAGWSTVGMDGIVDATDTIYAGHIVARGCGAFRVVRSN